MTEMIDLSGICREFVPLHNRTIYRLMAEEKFPKADISIGSKIRLWRRQTIEDWMDDMGRRNR